MSPAGISMKNNVMLILLSLSLAVFGVITGPAITLMPGRYNRKTVVLVIMAIFIVSNIAYAITHQYDVILFFRILPALTHAVFFAIALVVAANVVPPVRSAHAIAIVFSGVAVGMVLGMPLSAFIAEIFTLSAAFWFGALTSVVAFTGIALFVPSLPVFGISGYFGNFIFSRCLQRNVIKTTSLYPLLFILIYLAVWLCGSSPWLMVPVSPGGGRMRRVNQSVTGRSGWFAAH
ncbi:MFS transporter [Morganella morganii]|uniref:MFS transporter n=1 Tax=Morganella morganii TaxID=582 RepID=UPI0030814283